MHHLYFFNSVNLYSIVHSCTPSKSSGVDLIPDPPSHISRIVPWLLDGSRRYEFICMTEILSYAVFCRLIMGDWMAVKRGVTDRIMEFINDLAEFECKIVQAAFHTWEI